MNIEREVIVKALCIALSVLIVIGIVFIYVSASKKQEALTNELKELEAKVMLYDEEKTRLEKEITDLEKDLNYSRDKSRIMVGFVVNDPSDLAFVRENSQKYQFSPIVIIDCTMQIDNIKACLQEVDASWEIMMYAQTFSDAVKDGSAAVSEYLESVGKKDTGVFFIRGDAHSEESIALLKEAGFIGYTLYHDSPISWQNSDGMIYFDYSHIKSNSNDLVTYRLSECYSKKASMLFAFDMPCIKAGEISEESVSKVLGELSRYAGFSTCDFSTAAEVVSELTSINDTLQEKAEAYTAAKEKNQPRIEELKKLIAEIYSKFD